jgi:hypothetical protein
MNTAQPEDGCMQKNGTPLVSPTPGTPPRTRKHGRFMPRSPCSASQTHTAPILNAASSSEAAEEVAGTQLRQWLGAEHARVLTTQLVVGWHIARALGEPCDTLESLARLFQQTLSPEMLEQPEPQALADLLRYAASIAVRVSEHCGDEALRTICLGLAVHCSSSAARIQRQLLWPPG